MQGQLRLQAHKVIPYTYTQCPADFLLVAVAVLLGAGAINIQLVAYDTLIS